MIDFNKELSKTEIEDLADITVENIGNGLLDPLEVAAYCKKGIALYEMIIKKSYSLIVSEKERFEGNDLSRHSCKFSLSSTGERLSYEDDERYASISGTLKDRQNLLKTAYKSKELIYDADGAEVPKVALKSPSKQILKIEIK